jgi:hypothetical protein
VAFPRHEQLKFEQLEIKRAQALGQQAEGGAGYPKKGCDLRRGGSDVFISKRRTIAQYQIPARMEVKAKSTVSFVRFWSVDENYCSRPVNIRELQRASASDVNISFNNSSRSRPVNLR